MREGVKFFLLKSLLRFGTHSLFKDFIETYDFEFVSIGGASSLTCPHFSFSDAHTHPFSLLRSDSRAPSLIVFPHSLSLQSEVILTHTHSLFLTLSLNAGDPRELLAFVVRHPNMVTIAMDEVQQQQRIMEEVRVKGGGCVLFVSKRSCLRYGECPFPTSFLQIINGCWEACTAPTASVSLSLSLDIFE